MATRGGGGFVQRVVFGPGQTAEGQPLLPHWWLFFLPLYWFPQRVCWGLIETYLIPFQVAAIVGAARKHQAFSLMIVSANIGSFIGPMWGSLSDSCVTAEGRRRRGVCGGAQPEAVDHRIAVEWAGKAGERPDPRRTRLVPRKGLLVKQRLEHACRHAADRVANDVDGV